MFNTRFQSRTSVREKRGQGQAIRVDQVTPNQHNGHQCGLRSCRIEQKALILHTTRFIGTMEDCFLCFSRCFSLFLSFTHTHAYKSAIETSQQGGHELAGGSRFRKSYSTVQCIYFSLLLSHTLTHPFPFHEAYLSISSVQLFDPLGVFGFDAVTYYRRKAEQPRCQNSYLFSIARIKDVQ